MPESQMPKLSDTMTGGTLVTWRKKKGDKVSAGDVIAEIETDKATMEWESPEDGILNEIYVDEGGKVNVGDKIAFIGEPGEAASAKPAAKEEEKPAAKEKKPAATERKEEKPAKPAPTKAKAETEKPAPAEKQEEETAPPEAAEQERQRTPAGESKTIQRPADSTKGDGARV